MARASVDNIIESVILDRFPGGEIESIKVTRSVDYDGDPVLDIVVIVRTGTILDRKRSAGLVRHVRSQLAAIKEDSFPLFSFVSRSEAGKLGTEAA